MEENMENILLENCVKQYKTLIASLKAYLTSMYKDYISYDEIRHSLFTAIKIINTAEEAMKIYDFEDK